MTNVDIGDLIHYQCPEYANTKFENIGGFGKITQIENDGVWVDLGLGLCRFISWKEIIKVVS